MKKTIYVKYKGVTNALLREYEILQKTEDGRSHEPFCVPLELTATSHEAAERQITEILDRRIGEGKYEIEVLVNEGRAHS